MRPCASCCWGATAAAALLAAGLAWSVYDSARAQEDSDWHEGLPRQHDSKWLVHDLRRPEPPVVTPGEDCGDPPSDAIVLFDGEDLSKWEGAGGGPAEWAVRDGYMEVNDTGSIQTKQEFRDCQLHLEWRAPTPPRRSDQYRGNSGIFFMGHYEVQILDNYQNPTYADGYAAGVYGQHPPLANACRPPGEWQTYDVVFRAPRFDDEGEVEEPGRVTVFHNGVLTAHHAEIYGRTAWRQRAEYSEHGPTGPLRLQDHGDGQKVRFRNVWIRKLDLSPEPVE